MRDWKIDRSTPAKLGVAWVENVTVTSEPWGFAQLTACAQRYQQKFQEKTLGEIEMVQVARRLFRAVGIDPTRRRPSSEALLNRALKGKELYCVNNLVDVGNWCSLEFLLPICIYDADKIHGEVTVRQGTEADAYEALNHRVVNLNGRYLLADTAGAFGSPMTDSLRTAVDENTQNTILGIWAPQDFDSRELENFLKIFSNRVIEYCNGKLTSFKLFGSE